ncbi:RteC domain-containing protein [Ancylomarina subtilis]|nr:RteC domain-containing protein [Ancylomarina subtilis]
MIKEVNFIALRNELSLATIAFEKDIDTYKVYFNSHENYEDFKNYLSQLYFEFVNDLRSYISQLSSDSEKIIYLKMLQHIFELLKEQIGDQPNIEQLPGNTRIVSKVNSTVSCVYVDPNDLSRLVKYFKFQKKIIKKLIKLIKNYREQYSNCLSSICTKNNSNNDCDQRSYARFMRLKNEISGIESIPDKIDYLKKTRRQFESEFIKKGDDFYGSPLSLYFETTLDCLKDLSHLNEKSSIKTSNIKWKANTADFLELALALDQSNSFERKDGGELSRKELISQLSCFFNMDQISEHESRIHKISTRLNNTSFLQKLISAIDIFSLRDKN